MFFKPSEKNLAKNHSKSYLQDKYHVSENKLKQACKTGDIQKVKDAMKVHHKYEYALLYKEYYQSKK